VSGVRSLAVVRNGGEAIQYLTGERPHGCAGLPAPHVVFLDLKGPTDGFAMLEWFQAHPQCWAAPVMVLSSVARDEDLERAYQLGAPIFFKKPIVASELRAMLEPAFEWRRPALPEATFKEIVV
jgi:CheY-like chemotaxis protein